MPYGLHEPIPGGSEYHIEFDGPKQRELITIYLPPVGYTIDRIPDPETGVPTYDLVKCEILGENLPIEKQKWVKPELPKDWAKWRKEEKKNQEVNSGWIHADAEKFRSREWSRRINGVWQAIGNRNGKPTEYIYIPPCAYFYFAWWNPDFGTPRFRKVYLKLFYCLQYAEDHPKVHGVVFSTYRRFGKTAIAGCWTLDMPSRTPFAYGGLQGQQGQKALEFFDIHLLQPFKRLEDIDFFFPTYDLKASQRRQLLFTDPPILSVKTKALNIDEKTRKPLGGRISCANSSETAFDGKKMHRIWLEEPGKWTHANVLKTVTTYVPTTKDDRRRKIGLMLIPSTVEELDQGGQEFIDLFEKSMPSLMLKNKNGKTTTELIALFVPAFEGVIFDEYGRSIIEDPEPGLTILDEDGKQIKEGAKTFLKGERDSKETDDDRVLEIRKYPWTWFEAKMTVNTGCYFPAKILTKRLEELNAMSRPLFIRGNYEWVDEPDGDVEFRRDDISGRFQVAWQPNLAGGIHETSNRIINNVGMQWGEDIHGARKALYFPMNDHLFASGCDPISYKNKGKEKRMSNGGAHIFRRYDPAVDQGKPMEEWETHNVIVQYCYRPDIFETFSEDMIKMVRYWGCSINAEDNVQALRQYFDNRGYGAFILYRRDFTDKSLMGAGDMDRPVRSNEEVINTYVRTVNTFFYRHGHRMPFFEPLQQGLQFDPADTQKYDAIVSLGYTLLAADRDIVKRDESDEVEIGVLFPQFDNSGVRSVAV